MRSVSGCSGCENFCFYFYSIDEVRLRTYTPNYVGVSCNICGMNFGRNCNFMASEIPYYTEKKRNLHHHNHTCTEIASSMVGASAPQGAVNKTSSGPNQSNCNKDIFTVRWASNSMIVLTIMCTRQIVNHRMSAAC